MSDQRFNHSQPLRAGDQGYALGAFEITTAFSTGAPVSQVRSKMAATLKVKLPAQMSTKASL
jgi:hypothetical protein